MYPARYFRSFPAFPASDRAFVAMSFDPRLQGRWEDVIRAGVLAAGLQPHRVDLSVLGDSILTEIMDGVAGSRLVLADVTTLDGHRNANVMYELGMSHAVRQPEEVLILRSDSDRLPFDTATLRVVTYNPDDDPDGAREQVEGACRAALDAVDDARNLAVRQALRALSSYDLQVLLEAVPDRGMAHPPLRTMGDIVGNMQRLRSLNRLLEVGAVERQEDPAFDLETLTPETPFPEGRYAVTSFGMAIVHGWLAELGVDLHNPSPDLMRRWAESQANDVGK